MQKKDDFSVPKQMQPVYEEITAITNGVCEAYLNEEYAQLARKLTAALCRKRPSPLTAGRKDIWACGIVYALGSVNFLSDKSQTPHMRLEDLCERFGVSASSGAAKGKIIRNSLKMRQMDSDWCLPSRLDEHPLAWLITVNGLMVDARYCPRAIQEEAFRRGMIPYLPEPK